MVKLSNQKTPNLSRNKRRSSANYSRSVAAEDKKQNILKKFREFLLERQNKQGDSSTRKRIRSGNKSREAAVDANLDIKTIQRRKISEIKKYVILGVPAAVIITIVLIITLSYGKTDDKIPPDKIEEKNVTVYINNIEKLELTTQLKTVGELLKEQNITLEENQRSSHDEDSPISDGMEIYISTPITVYIMQNGIKSTVTVYGGTVEDALRMLEVNLDTKDIADPEISTLVEDEMVIEFIDVEIKQITELEDIPFDTEEGETNTVEAGYYAISEEGKIGTAEVTYEVKYVNGVEIDRNEISRKIIVEPISKVVLWGTAAKSSGSSGSSSSSSSSSSSNDSITIHNPEDQVTNPNVPAKPTEYISTMSCMVTAYTHTGGHTATGTWPRSTRTLDNPGSCAVVPSTIPYGSLLYVTGYGYCIAEDTGAFRNDPDRTYQIDVFMNTYDECIIWGRRYNVTVYVLREGYN